MINDRLVWYLENNDILTDIQCGFRKHRSTIDHLVRLDSFIRDAFLKVAYNSGPFFEKIMKRYPIFSLQINYYQIDQKHK